jgi:hypothetical protein
MSTLWGKLMIDVLSMMLNEGFFSDWGLRPSKTSQNHPSQCFGMTTQQLAEGQGKKHAQATAQTWIIRVTVPIRLLLPIA